MKRRNPPPHTADSSKKDSKPESKSEKSEKSDKSEKHKKSEPEKGGSGRMLSVQDLDDITKDVDMDAYTANARANSKEKKAEPAGGLIGGGGLMDMFEDLIAQVGQLGSVVPSIGSVLESDPEKEIAPDEKGGKKSDGPQCLLDGSHPFEVVEDGDFDGDDDAVQEFKSMGGAPQVIKIIKIHGAGAAPHLSATLSRLRAVHAASQSQTSTSRTASIRVAFSQVQATLRGEGAEHQVAAITRLDSLIATAQASGEKAALTAARAQVLAGTDAHLDGASYRLKQIVAARTPADPVVLRMADGTRPQFGRRVAADGSRLAYTTLETQGGEGYLLCPKGLTEMGRAVPMEISKCRDHCVDSRTSREGKTTCHFAHWLKVAADSNANVMARLEVQRNPDNDLTLITIAEGERSRPIKDGESIKPYELRMEERRLHKNTGEGKTKLDGESFDAWLADTRPTSGGQQGDGVDDVTENPGVPTADKRTAGAKKPVLDADSGKTLGQQVEKVNGKKPYGDTVIEELLKDEREMFDDDEYDILESMLGAKRENKK